MVGISFRSIVGQAKTVQDGSMNGQFPQVPKHRVRHRDVMRMAIESSWLFVVEDKVSFLGRVRRGPRVTKRDSHGGLSLR